MPAFSTVLVARALSAFALTLISACFLQAQDSATAFGFAVTTHNGIVYVAGEVVGALPGQVAYGLSDAFVRAYDTNGNTVWTRQFGTTAGDRAMGVAADDTGVYVIGFTEGSLPDHTNLGGFDAFTVKFDTQGNQLWLHQFGSDQDDHGTAAAADGTGVYVIGDTSGTLPGQTSAGDDDFFVRKYAPTGGQIWTTQFGSNGDDHSYGAAVTPAGVFVAGRTTGTFSGQINYGGVDAVLSKLDLNGVVQWNDQYGTSADDRGWAAAVDSTGIYEAGRSGAALPGQTYAGGTDDAYVAKFSGDASRLWIIEFGTTDYDRATGVATDTSGVYVGGVTAGSLQGTSAGGYDCFLRKYSSGVVLWTRQFGTSGDDEAYALAADDTGVYIVGATDGSLHGQTATSGAFIVKYDQNGNALWIQEFGAS